MDKYDMVIVGSGPSGLAAAIYGGRSEYSVAVFAGYEPLGQLMRTTDVENYPGYTSITGPELMAEMKKQAIHCGATFIQQEVTSIDIESGLFRIKTGESVYFAKTCIVATGSKPKLLELESEKRLWGHGISTCATCDGPLFKQKTVCVVGGGNTAAEEALFLSGITSKVYLIHRRDSMRADKILQRKLSERSNIEFLWDCEVQEFIGEQHLTDVMVYNKVEDRLFKVAVDAAFIAIGHTPHTELLKDLCPMQNGYIDTVPPKTNITGLFVAGDIADHVYRQAATAVGDGCKAGMDAIKFLQLGRTAGYNKMAESAPHSRPHRREDENRDRRERPPFSSRPVDAGRAERPFRSRPGGFGDRARGDRPFSKDGPRRSFRDGKPFGARPFGAGRPDYKDGASRPDYRGGPGRSEHREGAGRPDQRPDRPYRSGPRPASGARPPYNRPPNRGSPRFKKY